jgi:hypothetical protein
MKKIIIISIILLMSIWLNIYQYKNNWNNNVQIVKKSDINKDCYIMYVNTFMNSDWIEFSLPPIKRCLIEDIFKKGYELDWINNLILEDLLNQKEKHKFADFSYFVEPLKERFYIEIETADDNAMLYALQFIDDKEFTKELINKSLKWINKSNLIFYMKYYKKQWWNKEFLLNILKSIKWKIDEYSFNYIDYDLLLKEFSE